MENIWNMRKLSEVRLKHAEITGRWEKTLEQAENVGRCGKNVGSCRTCGW